MSQQQASGTETFYAYLTARIDTSLHLYKQVVEWMTEHGVTLSDLDNLLEEEWMGFPDESRQAQEYKQVHAVLCEYRSHCLPSDEWQARRLLACPRCQGKVTEHHIVLYGYECQECNYIQVDRILQRSN